jgi:hypothetical protein
MLQCEACGVSFRGIRPICPACITDDQAAEIAALRLEVRYLRQRCLEEGVQVHVPDRGTAHFRVGFFAPLAEAARC